MNTRDRKLDWARVEEIRTDEGVGRGDDYRGYRLVWNLKITDLTTLNGAGI